MYGNRKMLNVSHGEGEGRGRGVDPLRELSRCIGGTTLVVCNSPVSVTQYCGMNKLL